MATTKPTDVKALAIRKANFDAPDGLINQAEDADRILQLGRNGYVVSRDTTGGYFVSKAGGAVRYLPSYEALRAYSGEPFESKE